MEKVKKGDAAKIVGVTPRSVHYWTDEALLQLDVPTPEGKGYHRLYSQKNLVEFEVIRLMSRSGLDLKTIKQVMGAPRIISSTGFDPWDPESVPRNKADEQRIYWLVLYDCHTDNGKLVHQSTDSGKPLTHKKGLAPKDFESAIVINLTRARNKIIHELG